MDSEIRNELFALLREVNDAETMKDSQLRDCIDELEEHVLTSRQDPAAAAADAPGLDALLDSVHPESAVTAWLESRPEPESGIMAPHFMAKIETHGKNVFWGDGTTRISAIKNAVDKAKERE